METNARYLTIGAFTLAVILAAFGFVFWLEHSGGLAERETYLVHFQGTVSGLQPGAAVLFDGMRVGEVSGLNLDAVDPKQVLATLAIAKATPLRADTKVGIEFQGLMGTAVVSLEGGTAAAPLLVAQNGHPPVLTADPDAGRSLTETARAALKHVDAILSDNAAPLTDTIANLKEFSAALARNSGRVDGLMAGLERMAGSGPAAPPIPVYDLATPKLTASASGHAGQITINEPTAVVALQTQRLLTRSPEGLLTPVGTMQWSDSLTKLIQAKLLQSLDDAGVPATATVPAGPGPDDRQLQLDLRSFNLAAGASPSAEVIVSAKLVSGEGRIVRARVFSARVPSSGSDEHAAVTSLNEAFGEIANQLASWLGGET